jgi:cytochrome c5
MPGPAANERPKAMEESGMKTIVFLVTLAAVAAPALAADGKAIYEQHCASCHSTNKDANVPQIGLPGQWTLRLTSGRKSLIDSVRHGHNLMPVHGETMNKKDIGAAVDYIVSQVGGYPK